MATLWAQKLSCIAATPHSMYEKFPVHGFMSSIETPLHIGLQNVKADSMLLFGLMAATSLCHLQLTLAIEVSYRKNLPLFNYAAFALA